MKIFHRKTIIVCLFLVVFILFSGIAGASDVIEIRGPYTFYENDTPEITTGLTPALAVDASINTTLLPKADFNYFIDGNSVYFCADITSPGNTTWNWNYGDRTTGKVSNDYFVYNNTVFAYTNMHMYKNPGFYRVTNTAYNEYGSSSVTKIISISEV
jgi:PKD repeat protein